MSRRKRPGRLVWFLDGYVFPAIKAYATARLHILVLLCFLFVVLNPLTGSQVQLMLGNYTNVISASVSAICLRELLYQRHENRRLHRKVDAIHQHHGIVMEREAESPGSGADDAA